MGEVRFASLKLRLILLRLTSSSRECEKMAKLRYKSYVRKSQEDWSEE
jgi:pyruvate-ferredoxin/flavodoxin oxidoreductase